MVHVVIPGGAPGRIGPDVAAVSGSPSARVVVTMSGQGTPPSAAAPGGFVINLVPDSSVSQAPAGFTAAIQEAATILEQTFTNNITINIRYGWGTWDNAPDGLIGVNGAIGGPVADAFESYSNLKSWLTAAATTTADLEAVASLPASTTAFPGGQSQFILSSAQEKALGQFTGSPTAIDGAIGFGTGWTDPTDWVGGALHEITHAMGRTTDFYA